MSIPSWARKGVQVECIDAVDWLVHGAVYTVVSEDPNIVGAGLIWVVGPGVPSSTGPWGSCWYAYRFRPLVEDSEEDGIEARLFHSKGLKHHIKSLSETEAAQ